MSEKEVLLMKKRKASFRVLKVFGVFMGGIAFAVVLYMVYVVFSYSRIEDNIPVEVVNTTNQDNKFAEVNREYTIITYNIGFGAYTSDFSFFMDGGKSSWANSKSSVIACIDGDCELLKKFSPDILLLQEVDQDSTRSYHVDEAKMISDFFKDYAHNFAYNYNSAFFMYPITQPHGTSNAGLLTIADFQMNSALRRSLPITDSLYKLFDMDRCYVITRIPVNNGKELILYNVHLSAYTDQADVVTKQITMLVADIKSELEKENYVICGGDFNQDMLGNSSEIFGTENVENTWAKPFPTHLLPAGVRIASSELDEEERYHLTASCRNADSPYVRGESFVIFIDDFLISDNIKMMTLETIDNSFLYSDHNPVMMKFQLIE